MDVVFRCAVCGWARSYAVPTPELLQIRQAHVSEATCRFREGAIQVVGVAEKPVRRICPSWWQEMWRK